MNMNKNEEFDTILSIESREELNSIIKNGVPRFHSKFFNS